MDVIGDLVARERRRKEPLVYADGSQPYTAHKFCTDAWKTASLFRYHGVGSGRPVTIADDPTPQAVLSFFGAGLLGAPARFGDLDDTDARLVVGPTSAVSDQTFDPGTKRVVYGSTPDDPEVAHFERDIWSENPTMPPDRVDPDSAVLSTADGTYTHTELLAAAERVVTETPITDEDAVVVHGSLSEPSTLVGGVLAPLHTTATIHFEGADREGTVAVGGTDPPEPRRVSPSTAAL